jgi:phosphoglycerate dehydrogenase-like enzyme
VRILLSEKTAIAARLRIEQVLKSQPFEIVAPLDAASSDFDVAFLSREVTGRSTKLKLEPQTRVFHDALRQAKSLRWVHIHSAGADRPIFSELQSRGVAITTSSGANAPIVAQTALAGILALVRKFPILMEQRRTRVWKSLIGTPPRDLAGQTAVMVGWGPIGQLLAGWLEAMGVKIVVVRNSSTLAGAHPTYTYEQLRDVASSADWLVIACPLTDKTQRLVGKDVLGAMPAGAHLVNVGRGEVVVESELIAALEQGHLGGAFLDVFEHEPLPAESPLWGMANVIMTPHTAGVSAGNEGRNLEMFLDNLARFLDGKPLLRIADKT